MKQSRLFPPVFISFIAIVLVSVSHLSAALTSWDDFDLAASGYYNSLGHWRGNFTDQMLDLDEFNTFKMLWTTDSEHLHWNPDEIYGLTLFHDILIDETYAISDELLMLGINSQASVPDQPSELDNDIQPASEPADDIVFDNDAENIESLRTPAPSSLLLVAFGLLSLRYTRSLRL